MTKKTKQTKSAESKTPGKAKVLPPSLALVPDMKLLLAGPTNQAMETIMTKSKTKFDQFSQEANNAGRDGMDAFMKSTTTFAKGFEEIMRTSMALAQSAAEKQSQFIKEAMSAKTLNEFTEVQNKIAQSNFDDFMAGATKISEMSVKLFTEASEPLNEQANRTMQKAGSLAA